MSSRLTAPEAAERLEGSFGVAVDSEVRRLLATIETKGYDLMGVVTAILDESTGPSLATRVAVGEQLRRGLLSLKRVPRPSTRGRDDLVDRYARAAKALVTLLRHPRSAELFPEMSWPGAQRPLGPSDFADRLDDVTRSLASGAKELAQPLEPVFSQGTHRGRPPTGRSKRVLAERLTAIGLPREYRRKLLALLFC